MNGLTAGIAEMTSAAGAPTLAQSTAAYQSELAAANAAQAPIISSAPVSAVPFMPSGTYGSVATPGTAVTYSPSGGMLISVAQPSSVSSSMLLLGLGGVALLALLASRG